ncbi:MAG TPA: SAV_6107 family HEPN domain-containing protein, partial [Marmoricola sp.]|nr:SAV_6107 family HEPN domain-containing protein [Marmoricola sp.]
PEFGEWAAFFAAGASKRAAAEAGSRHAVSEREADDLVRDAEHFLTAVETFLGLEAHAPIRVA